MKIAARHSDLAKLQAYRVGDALRAAHPELEIDYAFRASLGDQNLNDPLWKMPEKGVFTEDFVRDLATGEADLVVHSWKDLPTDPRPGLMIAATLPRADQRDLFILKKEFKGDRLRVLTSSPRRAFNLDPFFRQYLPFAVTDVIFENVRGNIPTRLRKLINGDADGLILAKAAVDRLLDSRETEFADARQTVRDALEHCRMMVLPLSLNPTAAAQGALAVEVRSDRSDLVEMLAPIHDAATFAAVVRERDILASYGGGCHQKIGVSVVDKPFGRITYLQGLTDAGERLATLSLETFEEIPRCASEKHLFPRVGEESPFFKRESLPRGIWSTAESARFLFIARENAWPEGFRSRPDAVVWTAGVRSWKALASRGIWVSGSAESLGETQIAASFDSIARVLSGSPAEWTKLTHDVAASNHIGNTEMASVATYGLKLSESPPDLHGRTHFYWMSSTAFDRAVELHPEILSEGHIHASGPGHTHDHLVQRLGRNPSYTYLSVEQFRRAALGPNLEPS